MAMNIPNVVLLPSILVAGAHPYSLQMQAVGSSEAPQRTHYTTLCHGDITAHLHSPI